ncbi:FtsK/SpoIIIE domain-containing protein [Dorea longicatena]|uniref:FtsK/SpoIIIE domain-containing protein n=1 Tax=Dorea longicatena TaxID=88431 RepID=UPI0036F303FE
MNKVNIIKMQQGIRRIKRNKIWSLLLLTYSFFMLCVYIQGNELLRTLRVPFSNPIFKHLWLIFMIELEVMSVGIYLMEMGTPKQATKIEKRLKEEGFVDSFGNPPVLLDIDKRKKVQKYVFYSKKIPLQAYEKKKADMEIILNIEITKLETGKDMRHVIINGKEKSTWDKTKTIKWDNQYLSHEDFELVLGVNDVETVAVNIENPPHIMLGGETGSGKSNLLKLLAYQSVIKGAIVIIIDMKGGLDYQGFWREKCSVITERKEVADMLEQIEEERKIRNKLLYSVGAKAIAEYNEIVKNEKKLKRIVLVFDEVAELLDKTGISKEEREEYSKREKMLDTLARLGRACGIHLILCTQRPSADIIPGEVRSNLGIRICGRADSILSNMVLKNYGASELISEDDTGVFMTSSQKLFKAYYLDEKCLE